MTRNYTFVEILIATGMLGMISLFVYVMFKVATMLTLAFTAPHP